MQATGFLPRDRLQSLFDALVDQGYRTIAPTVADGAIQYRDVERAADLPVGWHDEQAPGRYRLTRGPASSCFGWANGPQALKPLLFAAQQTLWHASRDDAGRLSFASVTPDPQPLAVIGVRACDLAALDLHDRHFLDRVRDEHYARRRAGLFIVAVHCTAPAATCFCASTGDGPAATGGFDIALGELDDGFLVEHGTQRGADLVARLPLRDAEPQARQRLADSVREAAGRQRRGLPSRNLNDALFRRLQHPRWRDVAERCLSCGNCTSVCPTCFCHAERDAPGLGGGTTRHLREWDSCFTAGHSRLHGLLVRAETAQRYRQWLTHKLGSWHAQYGRSGCVGCGRCITWCPVGIDITVEAAAICGAGDAEGAP